MKPESKKAERSRDYQRLATAEDSVGEDRDDHDNQVGDTRGEVWRCFKTARRVKVFKTMRRVKVSQDDEKSVDGWTRTRATQTPQRAERRQYETKVSMD